MPLKALLLSGGYGKRLEPLTSIWPKCLMPVGGRPLLELWIDSLLEINVNNILVNVHYFSDEVINFLERKKYKNLVTWSYEENLLGTAGTLIKNKDFFEDSQILLAHADNYCTADLSAFYEAHLRRDDNCLMTMMTFETNSPENCGIVLCDDRNIMNGFYEKVSNPPSNHANGAVYLLGTEFLTWLETQGEVYDFSLDVIPHLIGATQIWKNEDHHIDIGTIENLLAVQQLVTDNIDESDENYDEWSEKFSSHPIHNLLNRNARENG